MFIFIDERLKYSPAFTYLARGLRTRGSSRADYIAARLKKQYNCLELSRWSAALRNTDARYRLITASNAAQSRAVRDHAKALKRGGHHTFIRLDADSAERQYNLEPSHDLSPDRLFDKSWALTVLDHTMESLERELGNQDRQALFNHLKVYLGVEGDAEPYKDIAMKLGMTEGAIKIAVHRLRKRYRQLLREEIAQTVATHDEVDEEIQDLLDSVCD